MPWRESSLMSEHLDFILACLDRSVTIAEICDRFGISEKTGHKRLRRFREEGVEGIADRSRARLTHPYRITDEVKAEIIRIRKRHREYGPKMIRDILLQRDSSRHWPAASSIGELLKRGSWLSRGGGENQTLTRPSSTPGEHQPVSRTPCGRLTSRDSSG